MRSRAPGKRAILCKAWSGDSPGSGTPARKFARSRRSDSLRRLGPAHFLSAERTRRYQEERYTKRTSFHVCIVRPRATKYSPIPSSSVTKPANACPGRSTARVNHGEKIQSQEDQWSQRIRETAKRSGKRRLPPAQNHHPEHGQKTTGQDRELCIDQAPPRKLKSRASRARGASAQQWPPAELHRPKFVAKTPRAGKSSPIV